MSAGLTILNSPMTGQDKLIFLFCVCLFHDKNFWLGQLQPPPSPLMWSLLPKTTIFVLSPIISHFFWARSTKVGSNE